MGEQTYHGLLDTGASNSLVAGRLVEQGQTQMGGIFGVKVGNGAVQLTSGETEGVVHVGEEDIPFSFATFDTDVFDVILGNDFFEAHPHIKYLSLQAPHHLLVQRHGQLVEVPLNEDPTGKTLRAGHPRSVAQLRRRHEAGRYGGPPRAARSY